ncbi:MAG TPA: hypothetical protein VFS60_08360 [Thermoanaerobaculia bacterium]|nr:hypothetical protein [Thermoanaerobaculia bacterium]
MAAELAEQAPASPSTRSLLATAEAAGMVLEPTHPGADDEELRTWFHADVADQAPSGQLLTQLQAEEAIESAFVKPPDEPP